MSFGLLLLEFSAVVLMLSGVAKANDSDVLIVPKTMVVEDSSQYHRMNKKYFLGAQILGAGPTASITSGVIGGYYLDLNSLVTVELLSGSIGPNSLGSTTSSQISSSISRQSARSIGVHFQKFSENSFFWKLGGDYRLSEWKYSYSDSLTPANNSSSTYSGNSITLSGSIGNSWQWENFTMGCEWIGFAYPILSSSPKNDISAVLSPDERSSFDRDINTQQKNMVYQSLHFFIGASW